MSSELPKGWQKTSLFAISKPKQWKTVSIKNLTSDGYHVYGANGIIGHFISYTHEVPTLMITCRGASCGNIHKSLPKSYINGNAMALDDLSRFINIDYLYFFLKSADFKSVISGSAQPQITQEGLQNLNVVVAPLNEQIGIANKLDSLLAKVDATQIRLERIPTLLKRFRQSVLAVATSGKLTKKWREGTDFKLQIKTLGDTGTVVKTGPFGSALHKRDYVAGGIPIINPMHINHGKLMPSNSMTISTEKYLELSAWHLREGDVIVGRRGEMGRAAVVADGKTKMLCGTGSMILRVDDTALPKYLELILRSPTSVEYFIAASVGSTMVNLNQGVIKNLKVHFPPLQEQKEIVSRVESLFSVAESVEKQYTEAKKRTDRLTQSLLAKAFRGELVPQDTNDEPASELINRIQAEREQQAANKPKPKTVTKRKIKKK